MIDKEAIVFLERFLEDEGNFTRLTYSLADIEEVREARGKYVSHFAFPTWDDSSVPRGDSNDKKWLARIEEMSPIIRKRPVFMIRQFKKEERIIFQYYLGAKEKLGSDNFDWMLFAENTKEGFKIISSHDWEISGDADLKDEMSYWWLYKGECILDRGTLIATVRYREPYKEDQKKVYFMEP
jgi:hypothetical protein